jgi:hypothetical protein
MCDVVFFLLFAYLFVCSLFVLVVCVFEDDFYTLFTQVLGVVRSLLHFIVYFLINAHSLVLCLVCILELFFQAYLFCFLNI